MALPRVHLLTNPIPLHHFSPVLLCFQFHPFKTTSLHPSFCALRARSHGGRLGSQESYGSDLLRKPVVKDSGGISEEDDGGEEEEEEEEEKWVDWEDKILEDTVPLVGFVRMILHSGKYESGDRLSPEHERTIVERLLPYHPASQKKIGCGIDYITVTFLRALEHIGTSGSGFTFSTVLFENAKVHLVGYHPDFESSRCLFIVRKDGELVDFSYWKCIKGLIRKNYPLYADSFILRHFRKRRSTELR